MTLIICLLIGILIISLYQIWILKYSIRSNQSPDIKYFELKYQIESYVKVFAILIAIAAYFGYDKFSKSKEDIEKAYVEPLNKYKERLDSINLTTKYFEEFVKRFNAEKEAIKSVLLKTGNDAKGIERDINLLASSKINQLKIYTVIYKTASTDKSNDGYKTIYFKDLKNYNGNSLPKFKKPPVILIQSIEAGSGQSALKISTESFDVPVYIYPNELSWNAIILSED